MGSHKFHGKDKDFYLATPVTNTLHVDNKRTDTYLENGSITKPFKTIQAAHDSIIGNTSTNKFEIKVARGTKYTETFAYSKDYVMLSSVGLGATLSGAITITSPHPTFVDFDIQSAVTLSLASHFSINVINCRVTTGIWNITATAPTGDEYLQVLDNDMWTSRLNATGITGVVGWSGGIIFSGPFNLTNCYFQASGTDIEGITINLEAGTNAYLAAILANGLTINLKPGATLNIDADTEGGTTINNTGGTLNQTTKASNVKNDSSVTGVTVKNALDNLGNKSHDHPITHLLYVDGNRSDIYIEDGSLTKPFKKIQDAIDSAVGATTYNRFEIRVNPCEYVEQIVMKAYVHLYSGGTDSVFIFSNAGDVITTSVDANIANFIVSYTGIDSSKVALRVKAGAVLVAHDFTCFSNYNGIDIESGAIAIFYCGGSVSGNDSVVVRNGAYAAFSGFSFSGWGAPYYDLTIEAGATTEIVSDCIFYNELINNLGNMVLKTPASRIKNDSTVVGNNVKEALETLGGLSHNQDTDQYLTTLTSTVLYVDGNRGDSYTPNGSITRPFKTIMAAINSVTDASANKRYTIDIVGGKTYSEQVILKAYVGLRSPEVARIQNPGGVGHTIVASSMSAVSRLQNLVIINNSSDIEDAAVFLGSSGNVGMTNCSLTGETGYGLKMTAGAFIADVCIFRGVANSVKVSGGNCIADFCTFDATTFDVNVTGGTFKYIAPYFKGNGITGVGTRLQKADSILNDSSVVGTSVKNALETLNTEKPTISSGILAPTSTPTKVGDIYIDTVAKKLYFATGVTSSADWIIAN